MPTSSAAHSYSGQKNNVLDNAYGLESKLILSKLNVEIDAGLSSDDIEYRQKHYGLNIINRGGHKSSWLMLLDQLRSLLTVLLLSAAALSFAFQDLAEGIAIVIVIALNTVIGFYTERKAIRSIEALRHLGTTLTLTRRDGHNKVIAAEQIVPGDIVLLNAGDAVTADLRILQATQLQCDESLLTGESTPVNKQADALIEPAPLYTRNNMAFKGTTVLRGSATGVAVATGMHSELGRISSLTSEAAPEMTPLDKRLKHLSQQLIGVTLCLATIITLIGIAGAREPILMIKTGIALAVAAIPESLPIVATFALARGMWRLARRNALIKHLSAVETLGSVTTIFTDKTGTLTQNRMTVTDLLLPQGEVRFSAGRIDSPPGSSAAIIRALRVCAWCNNATLATDEHVNDSSGDPMEQALLAAVMHADIPLPDQHKVGEQPFDPDTRMMITYHQCGEKVIAAVKGAPEVILAQAEQLASDDGEAMLSDSQRNFWLDKTSELAANGLRVLALAEKSGEDIASVDSHELVFLGLVGLQDPPRLDARAEIEKAQQAGINVVMVTGDNAVTAASIAAAVGISQAHNQQAIEGTKVKPAEQLNTVQRQALLDTDVFARINPQQKLDLISLYQHAGQIVAMTGDGVNDAPALQKADIGISMGVRGTEVAKQASDMILKDDAFGSITAAIAQGRTIFSNIRQFVVYLLSCNISEILLVTLGVISGLPLPLLPLQILFLNLVTDVFPALALGAGESDEQVLKRPPRSPQSPIIGRRHWLKILLYGSIITVSVLIAFLWALQQPDKQQYYPTTVAFLTLAFAQMWHVFNMSGHKGSIKNNHIVRNPYIWIALVISAGLLGMAIYSPLLAATLVLSTPDLTTWGVIVGASLIPLLIGQIFNPDIS